jgi:hypothetical protein
MVGNLRIGVGVQYGTVLVGGLDWMAGSATLSVINGDVEGVMEYTVRKWDSLRSRFEAEAVAMTPSDAAVALYEQISTQLEQRLAGYQKELYARIVQELKQGALLPLAVELAGSKALLQSFTVLGLQDAVANDEFLHALLFGDQQIVDDVQIRQTYDISAAQLITEVNVLSNPRLLLRQVADERTSALSEIIAEYLAAISASSSVATAGNIATVDNRALAAQSYIAEAGYIANTRRALELTVRIAHLVVESSPTPTPSPSPSPDTGQVYLPLVEK